MPAKSDIQMPYLSGPEVSDVAFSGGIAPKELIVGTLSHWSLYLHELMVVCVDTNTKSVYDWGVTKRTEYDFFADPSGDAFIGDLMELSLSHNIMMLSRSRGDFSSEFKVYLEESKDGTTNIDVDVVEAFQKAIRRRVNA